MQYRALAFVVVQTAGCAGGGFCHEQPESPGRGNDTGRTYLQLTLFPSEQEQIQRIDEAESVKPSAFAVSQADIDAELRRGTGYGGGKLRVYGLYQHVHQTYHQAAARRYLCGHRVGSPGSLHCGKGTGGHDLLVDVTVAP